ncbi:MAG: ATP-dependent DNA helicase RecG, partial [Bacteroidetes bacterium]|nr:ATP-dependent DNA helicase RecG [Bacteroidota bacterium]
MNRVSQILSSPIEYLKGVGPRRAELLKKELNIFTFNDLLEHFPYRHVDKTKVNLIQDITSNSEFVQVAGVLVSLEVVGQKRGRRVVGQIKDKSGFLELAWFQGLQWVQKTLKTGSSYLVYGKVTFFKGNSQIVHPEIELLTEAVQEGKNYLEPIYSTTEKLKANGLGGRQIGKLTQMLLQALRENDLPENLPEKIIMQHQFINRFKAFQYIHFPPSADAYDQAVKRLKFEELFIAQLRMGLLKSRRHRYSKGVLFDKVG